MLQESDGVNGRVQTPLSENDPPTPPSLHDTVPPGKEDALIMSSTLAVRVIPVPILTDAEAGPNVIVVGCASVL